MNLEFKNDVWKGGFRPTAEAESFEERLRAKLGLTGKNESARLSIGRSLAEPTRPDPVGGGASRGKAIAGEYLFGDDIDLWMAAVILDGSLGPQATVDNFREIVEAHWARGALLLQADLQDKSDDEVRLVQRLADLLPVNHTRAAVPTPAMNAAGAVRIAVGPASRSLMSGERVEIVLNDPGTSPHIALMGKTRSGKTTTGIQMAVDIQTKCQIPLLIIDPKGEFVDGDLLLGRLADAPSPIRPIEVGEHSIPLDFLPDPSVGSAGVTKAAMQFRDTVAACCKGVGDIQQMMLRSAVEKVIKHERPRDLPAVRDWYRQELSLQQKKPDSVMSRLDELTSLRIFTPELSPERFFSQSWVISLKSLGSEELKRQVILLLLDALRSYVLSHRDEPLVNGHRALRHVLVIDEARRILADRKNQSLVDIVRQGASKGEVVVLLSQDPSDFEGQVDDFTTQLGTVIAFACAQTQRGLRALQGAYGRRLQPSEFSDTYLPPGIAFAKLPGEQAQRIHCWGDAPER